jgi:hypothetical protein
MVRALPLSATTGRARRRACAHQHRVLCAVFSTAFAAENGGHTKRVQLAVELFGARALLAEAGEAQARAFGRIDPRGRKRDRAHADIEGERFCQRENRYVVGVYVSGVGGVGVVGMDAHAFNRGVLLARLFDVEV